MEPLKLFAVVRRDGQVYTNRENRYCIYESQRKAEREADEDGDSVVAVTVHLDLEPLFIRSQVMDVG